MPKIIAIRPSGRITKAELIRLGSDPLLKHFQIICHWEDGATTTGWSSGITNGQLTLGVTIMQIEVNNVIFED